jgi:hypothetical protein
VLVVAAAVVAVAAAAAVVGGVAWLHQQPAAALPDAAWLDGQYCAGAPTSGTAEALLPLPEVHQLPHLQAHQVPRQMQQTRKRV